MNNKNFSIPPRFWLTLPALLLAATAAAHQDPIERELHQLLDAFLAGASANDIEMHDRFWAEDLVYTSSSGERRGKAETMAALRAARGSDSADLPEYSGEDVNIRVFDDFAVITFRLVARLPGGNVNEYFNTGVFRQVDGQWRAFTWQATQIPGAKPTG